MLNFVRNSFACKDNNKTPTQFRAEGNYQHIRVIFQDTFQQSEKLDSFRQMLRRSANRHETPG